MSAELFALAGLERKTGDVLLRVVNRAAIARGLHISLQGVSAVARRAKVTTLSHADPTTENTVDFPDAVKPRESTIDQAGADFTYAFPPHSFTLLRLTPARSR